MLHVHRALRFLSYISRQFVYLFSTFLAKLLQVDFRILVEDINNPEQGLHGRRPLGYGMVSLVYRM